MQANDRKYMHKNTHSHEPNTHTHTHTLILIRSKSDQFSISDNIFIHMVSLWKMKPSWNADESRDTRSNQSLKMLFLKVACRVQIWKKTFCQNSDKFGYSFIKNDMFMYLLCIYKKLIILSLFNIDTLNFTTYILKNLTCPLKTCH